MNIQEATKKALAENKCIKREGWILEVLLKPTLTGYSVISGREHLGYRALRGWQPKTDDVLSDDWLVLDYNKDLISFANR